MSSGTEVTLNGVLVVLDEHYNNVKVPDPMNQELFQLQIGKERNGIRVGVYISRHLQIIMALFLEWFPSDYIAKLKYDHLYGGLPKWFKVMVAYLKASTNGKMYSDYFQVAQESREGGGNGSPPEPGHGQHK